MNRNSYGFFALALAALWSAAGSEGSLEGQFKYWGYEIEFRDWTMSSHGETKSIFIDATDIATTPSNTFLAGFSGIELQRSITNEAVNTGTTTNSDWRLYNRHVLRTGTETGSAGGTISMNDNLVLSVLPESEESPIRFCFNTTTNVALTLLNRDTESLGIALLLRKGSGMSAGSVSGTYTRVTLGNSFSGAAPRGEGRNDTISLETALMQFNGTGSYTETANSWESTRITFERDVNHEQQMVVDTYFTLATPGNDIIPGGGTYSVQSDGTLLLNSGFGTITNQVSPDGDLVASVIYMSQGDSRGTYLTAAVRHPENMTNTAIDAVYYLLELGEDFSGYSLTAEINRDNVEGSISYLFLRSDHTFSMRADYWEVENSMENERFNIVPHAPSNMVMDYVSANVFSIYQGDKTVEFDSGTYSIASNGVITLDFGYETGVGQISANGEYVLYGYGDGDSEYSERALGIGIRRNPPQPMPSPGTFTGIHQSGSDMVIEVSVPTNYPIEALYTESLTGSEWRSTGVYGSDTGTLEFVDPDAGTVPSRFYMTTFAPW